MTDLLTSDQKNQIHKYFDHIHDTFARDITVYKTKEETLIDTDGNHNPLYGNPNRKKREILASYTTKARIKYEDEQKRVWGIGDSQINVSFPKGTIRLKVDKQAYDLITTSKKIKIDDRLCELISGPSRPGPFNPNYWTIYIKQVD